MSFDNFKQADYREAANMDYDNHCKRVEEQLKGIIEFFAEEDEGMILYIIRIKNLNIEAIKKVINDPD